MHGLTIIINNGSASEINAVDKRTDRNPKSRHDPSSDKTPKLINYKFCAKNRKEKEKCLAWARPAKSVARKSLFSCLQ